MSEQSTYIISCPKCQEAQSVDLYDSVNVAKDPELKERLLSNQLNRVTCGPCELDFRVDKNLLYTDPAHRAMVYLMPCTLAELDRAREEFEATTQVVGHILPGDVEAPELHLVIDRTELVEKIFLFEAGVNDRLIEYIKYMIYVRNPEAVDPRTQQLLFNAQDSTDESMVFVVRNLASGAFENVLQYDRKAYEALAAALVDSDDQAAVIMEMFPGPHISARAHILAEEEVEDEVEGRTEL